MIKFLCRAKNTRGFTLMEMLIVVAIIAVLAAIAIPVFSTQIEKTRLATDAANLRTAETLAVADMLVNEWDTAASQNPTIAATPDAAAASVTVANATAYYFNTASQGAGLEIAMDDTGAALAPSGNFKSAYDDDLTIVVYVDANGEVAAAGWVAAGTTTNP